MVVEDCTVVYARAKWHEWSGGRLFNMRGEGGGSGGDNVIFREGSDVAHLQIHVLSLQTEHFKKLENCNEQKNSHFPGT